MACCLALKKKAKVVTEDVFEDFESEGQWIRGFIYDTFRMVYPSVKLFANKINVAVFRSKANEQIF